MNESEKRKVKRIRGGHPAAPELGISSDDHPEAHHAPSPAKLGIVNSDRSELPVLPVQLP
jgi:hypothetical protein